MKITIVGGGPVGSLLSVMFAQRGFRVQIFERRPDMRQQNMVSGRSINLAVSTRGINALKVIGLDQEILAKAVPMRGRLIHAIDGDLSYQPYGADESECINSISRSGLNSTLMTAAENSGLVSIDFNQKALDFDFQSNTLKLHNQLTDQISNHRTNLLFATDGSASAIRQAMDSLPGHVSTEEFLDYGYKELHIGPGPGGQFLMEKNALHIWPRGTFMLIALPNFDGSYTCTLFLPLTGMPSFAQLDTPQAVSQFFKEHFPDVMPLIENLTDVFFGNPTGHMSTIHCQPWHIDGKALLVGDAAHGIVPFFGQGMNAGFEDCTVVNQCLDSEIDLESINWHDLFDRFYAARKANTDAIADMALENFIEMRDKVADPKFQLEKKVEKILDKNFPGQYYSRYRLVTFTNVPYKVALDAGLIVDQILSELCCNLTEANTVDLQQAKHLIDSKLTPSLSKHLTNIPAS